MLTFLEIGGHKDLHSVLPTTLNVNGHLNSKLTEAELISFYRKTKWNMVANACLNSN